MKISCIPLNEDLFQLSLEWKVTSFGPEFGTHQTRIYLLSLSREKIYRLEDADLLAFAENLTNKGKKK